MDSDNGFYLFLGTVIISICIGIITEPVYGWLFAGVMLLIVVIINLSIEARRNKHDHR